MVYQIDEYQAREYMKSGEPYQLVDVRTEKEFAGGHIPGAKNLPLNTLPVSWKTLDPTVPVLLYCQSGGRANQAAAFLSQVGIQTVFNFGGIEKWTGDVVR